MSRYRCDHALIAMPPIECPAITARSPGAQRRVQDGLQVAGQVVEAVVVPVARDLAAAVAAVVERDHPVVFGEVGDLVLARRAARR